MNGVAVMLEVKRPGGAGATELQRRELQRWHDAGALCAVARSVDDAKLIVGCVERRLLIDAAPVNTTTWEIERPDE